LAESFFGWETRTIEATQMRWHSSELLADSPPDAILSAGGDVMGGRGSAGRGGGAAGSSPVGELTAAQADTLFDATKSKLTQAEREALFEYQRSADFVNNIMRGRTADSFSPEARAKFDAQILQLKSAFAKAEGLSTSATLYRGLNTPPAGAKVGAVFSDKAPASTSFNRRAWEQTGFDRSKHILKITAPAGTKAIPLHKTMHKSNPYKKQKEMLLAPGTKMKINSITKNAKGQTVYDVSIVK
jgi:hypothetical protein